MCVLAVRHRQRTNLICSLSILIAATFVLLLLLLLCCSCCCSCCWCCCCGFVFMTTVATHVLLLFISLSERLFGVPYRSVAVSARTVCLYACVFTCVYVCLYVCMSICLLDYLVACLPLSGVFAPIYFEFSHNFHFPCFFFLSLLVNTFGIVSVCWCVCE